MATDQVTFSQVIPTSARLIYFNLSGQPYNTTTPAYENWTDGDYANYQVNGTQQGTSPVFLFTRPAGVTVPFVAAVVIPAGGTPSTDTWMGGSTQLVPDAAPGAASGLPILGSNTGPMSLSGGLTITNNAGDALNLTSQGGGGNGINAIGNGSGNGIWAQGGFTGIGILAYGGGSSGDAIKGQATSGDGLHLLTLSGNGINAVASGGNGHGIFGTGAGSGDGIRGQGALTGAGFHGRGGATSGDGMLMEARGGNSNGIEGVGVGLGGSIVSASLAPNQIVIATYAPPATGTAPLSAKPAFQDQTVNVAINYGFLGSNGQPFTLYYDATGWSEIVWTAKKNQADADAAAILAIKVSSPPGGSDGLYLLNGAAPSGGTTASDGTITNVTVATATSTTLAQLNFTVNLTARGSTIPAGGYYWEVAIYKSGVKQQWFGTGFLNAQQTLQQSPGPP